MHPNLFIITGGPGTGKTTLLAQLEKRGFRCISEVARKIIQEQVVNKGRALPWDDTDLYKKMMHDRSVSEFVRVSSLDTNENIFFDRGIIDTIAYARLIKSEITSQMDADAKRYKYNNPVFILPFWEDIYQTDTERKQTIEEAELTCKMIGDTYRLYGYATIEVPKISVVDRADFILHNLK